MNIPVLREVARRGFTLLEVMVATSIMVIIVLAVVTIASDTFRAYDRAVADLSTQSEARGVLDALENDLQTAVVRPDGRCWMEIVIPGASGAPAGGPDKIGNMQGIDQPILMFFAAPPDRPRWNPVALPATPRQSLKGDVCAVAYRLGQRSPFDMPGEPIQQVYGVYRTIIDPENTFNEALPIIMSSTSAVPKSPWDYWTGGARWVNNYSATDTSGQKQQKVLLDANLSANPPCWTLDDQNFVGSNVVAMNITLWCSSSLPVGDPTSGKLVDPVYRTPQMLRPVIPSAVDSFKFGSTVHSGYFGAFKSLSTATPTTPPLRYAPTSAPAVPVSSIAPSQIHPFDVFGARLRIFADRMYPDTLMPLPIGVATVKPLPYLPYSIKAIEVSLTVLTPDGSKELRALQQVNGSPMLSNAADYKRIVNQNGRNYTRYIRLLSNGG